MESIGVRELRQNASRYLERVKRGESIQVTDRGVPVAMLTPVAAERKSRYQEMLEQGLITPGKANLQHYLGEHPPQPLEANYAGPSVSEILEELREERL